MATPLRAPIFLKRRILDITRFPKEGMFNYAHF